MDFTLTPEQGGVSVSTAVLQAITIGAAILRDKRANPIFPRWSAYLNFWCAFLFMPGGLVVFFKHGPFGWNGLIAWWLLLTAFGVWVLTMSVLLLREAIPHQEREQSVLQASSASVDLHPPFQCRSGQQGRREVTADGFPSRDGHP
jgi:hypothetical protein